MQCRYMPKINWKVRKKKKKKKRNSLKTVYRISETGSEIISFMKRSKKSDAIIEKFKIDTEGMTSVQKLEYIRLSDLDKEKFVKKFREDKDVEKEIPITDKVKIRYISHDNHIEDRIDKNKMNSKSKPLSKKEIKKGLRAERIWVRGNKEISHECKASNNVRNAGQYLEREHYFENEKLRKERNGTEFKIKKKDRYISYQDLDKMKDKIEIGEDGKDIYSKFREAYYGMRMATLAQQILMLVGDSWESYYEGLFGYLAGNPNYTGMPKIPGYGDKGGEYIVVIPNDKFWIVSGQDVGSSWEIH